MLAVRVPIPRPDLRIAVFKLSKRVEQDISAVCIACAVQVEAGHIRSARIALGGMAAVAARAPAAEQALIGAPWSQETFETAAAGLARDFQPLSDLRASSEYRMTGAANLLRRFFHSYEPHALTRLTDVQLPAGSGAGNRRTIFERKVRFPDRRIRNRPCHAFGRL